MDYAGNTDKSKEPPKRPEKQIEKVVTGEVIQKPKGLGHRFKSVFLGGDMKLATRYVMGEVLLPALRNLVFDAVSKGTERLVFGDSMRRRPTDFRPRTQYHNPFGRTIYDVRERERLHLPDQPPRPQRVNRRDANDIILADRGEAELVLERLIDVINQYEVASLADLYDLLGLPSSHVDNKWGWTYLSNVEIRQVRDGYLLELPVLEEI